ncbi:MAG: hypothetical protein H6817_05155 [Phycisphaerales bacterium]|nr:hypothetical protein [Phycisphaerales bacterium]
MNPNFTIPRLPDPQRYTGTYLVQVPHGVAVGYLAGEVVTLLSIDAYRDAPVFRIHRVDDTGRVELIGVTVADLAGDDVLLFVNSDAEHAGTQFSTLRQLANADPLPIPVRAELIDLPGLSAPHAVCLLYPRHANTMVSDWLLRVGFDGGDQVLGGQEAASIRHQVTGSPVATMTLAAKMDETPRSREELLASVKEPLQR